MVDMRTRRGAALLTTTVLLVASCMVPALDLGGKACPCTAGFVCDIASNRCLAPDEAGATPPPPPPDSSATDAGPDGAINLLSNPGFEQGGAGCGAGWNSYGATTTRSTQARTGMYACELCPSPVDAGVMELLTATPVPVEAGSYTVEAWIRAPGSGPSAGGTGVQWRFHEPDGAAAPTGVGGLVTPGATWIASNGSLLARSDGSLDVLVHVYYPMGGCVLVDDLGLYPAK
jgi:hypothetical protein